MVIDYPEELNFLQNSKKTQKESNISMKDKVCIITGSTSGVGLSALKRMAEAGADLVMVCRNAEKAKIINKELEQQFGREADIIIADFSNLDSVREASNLIRQKYRKIDVFINSAGIHSTKCIHNDEGFELAFCVNHLAPFLMTWMLKDNFRESGTRVILVNSEGHRFNGLDPDDLNWNRRLYTGLRGYGASKTAQLLCMMKFCEMFSDSDVTINAMHPGDVRTNIGNNNGFLYRWFLHNFTWHFLKDVSISGKAIHYLATAEELKDKCGLFYNLTIEELCAKHARNRAMAEIIWKKSLEMCEIGDKI